MTKTAFIGLGVMGFPMAGHKAAKGHEVTVYNRTAAKAEKWAKEHGGSVAATPREAAAGVRYRHGVALVDAELAALKVAQRDGQLVGAIEAVDVRRADEVACHGDGGGAIGRVVEGAAVPVVVGLCERVRRVALPPRICSS